MARLPAEAVYAHELRYRFPPPGGPALTLAISQSGETADTLAAARMASERDSRLLALTNVVGSTLTRVADDVIYTRGGPEVAVASTKAYLAMLVGECLLALWLARRRRAVGPAAGSGVAGRNAGPARSDSRGSGPLRAGAGGDRPGWRPTWRAPPTFTLSAGGRTTPPPWKGR